MATPSVLTGLPTTAQGQAGLSWFYGNPDPVIRTDMQSGSYIDQGDQLPSILPPETPLPPSFAVGTPSTGVWQEMKNEDLANVGDTLRFTYRLRIPFLEDWQSGALASKLSKDDRFQLHFIGVNEEQSKVRIEATIVKPMTPAILVAGAILAVAIGLGVWLAIESVERLTTIQNPFDPTSKINLFPVLAVLGGLIFLVAYTRRR